MSGYRLLSHVLVLTSLALVACAAQQQPAETAAILPGADDEERQAARFGQPENSANQARPNVGPPTADAAAAPGGTVETLDGKPLDLAAAYAKRNVVLVFYRGGWCRFCRRQLGELQDLHKEMSRGGTDLLAVSTESADLGAELSKKLGIQYPVLVDRQGQTSRKWGVLDEANGIAKLSTFVIQRGGAIVFRHIATEAADYPPTAEVMEKVSALPAPQ